MQLLYFNRNNYKVFMRRLKWGGYTIREIIEAEEISSDVRKITISMSLVIFLL